MSKAIELLTEAIKDLTSIMQLNFNKVIYCFSELNSRISKLEKELEPEIDFDGYSYEGESFLDIFIDGERVIHCRVDADMFYDERDEDEDYE